MFCVVCLPFFKVVAAVEVVDVLLVMLVVIAFSVDNVVLLDVQFTLTSIVLLGGLGSVSILSCPHPDIIAIRIDVIAIAFVPQREHRFLVEIFIFLYFLSRFTFCLLDYKECFGKASNKHLLQ